MVRTDGMAFRGVGATRTALPGPGALAVVLPCSSVAAAISYECDICQRTLRRIRFFFLQIVSK